MGKGSFFQIGFCGQCGVNAICTAHPNTFLTRLAFSSSVHPGVPEPEADRDDRIGVGVGEGDGGIGGFGDIFEVFEF